MKFDLKNSPRHIQRLKNIANVISGIPDITVIISSGVKGPYFSPSRNFCVLPNGDYSDQKFVELTEGFICHEAGHGRYTDSDQWQEEMEAVLSSSPGFQSLDSNHEGMFDTPALKRAAYAKSRRLGGLINLFDDIQMERQVGGDFAQAGPRLARTYQLMVEAGLMTCDITSSQPDPVRFLEGFLLNSMRVEVLKQEGQAVILEPFFEFAATLLKPYLSELTNIIHDAHSSRCTGDAIRLAKQTLSLIVRMRDEAKEQQQDRGQTDDQTPDADDSDNQPEAEEESDSNADDDADDSDAQSDDQKSDVDDSTAEPDPDEDSGNNTEEATGESEAQNGNETEKDGQSDQENGQADETGGEEESNFSSEQWAKLEELLNDFLECDEESPDYHDQLAGLVEQIAEACPAAIKAEFGGSPWDLPDLPIDIDVYNEAVRLSQTVAGDLSMLQQANVRTMNKTRDRGVTFDPGRLIQAPMGVRDVFRTPGASKSRGHIGIVILRDISASMASDDRYIHAIKADLALSLALQSYGNMHVANMLFPYRTEACEIIKSFDQSVEETISRFDLGKPGSHTPTGDALKVAHDLLLESQFDRKIVLLITDGEPTRSNYSVEEVLKLADKNGIEVAGIGINTDELEGFKSGTFVNVEDISMLALEVNKLVMDILTN